jgi:hypothetical protein
MGLFRVRVDEQRTMSFAMMGSSRSDAVGERAFDRKEGKRKESNSNQLEKKRARPGGTG